MPIYDYRCSECGTEYHNIRAPISERNNDAPECCGERTKIILRPTRHVHVYHFEGYDCPVTEVPVTSQGQRKDIMAKHDLVDKADIKLRTVNEF